MANLQRFYLKKDEHTYWTLPVDTQTTAQDICDAIASKLELKSGSCFLLESKVDKNATWEREIAGTEKILTIQSKWNPKKYSQKFVVVKPIKVVKRENRNSTHVPTPTRELDESWKEKAHEEIEVLKKEVQILSESNADLQQQLFEEKQKRNAMQNSSEVVKRLMEAEQQIDDLRVAVSDMQEVSNHLEVENTQLFHELKEAAHAIGGPYEEKVNAMQRSTKPTPKSTHPSQTSPAGHPRVYFEGTRSENSPDYLRKLQDHQNMTSMDFDRHLEVASLGLDFAELQKSQRAREKALEESKQKLREELDLSKQRRSDVLKESNQILLEELEAIKSKSDLSKKKFVDSLHASKKKLEQELDVIEKKRRAQEEVRWSRPMDGFSSTLSPSKQDGFSISPANSPSPTRRDPGSSSRYDSSPTFSSSKFDSPSKFDSSSRFDSSSNYDSPPKFEASSKFDSPSKYDSSIKFDSPSKYDSPLTSKFDSPSKYDSSTKFDSPTKFDSSTKYDSPSKFDPSKIEDSESLSPVPSAMFSSSSYRPSTSTFSTKTDRAIPSTASPSASPSPFPSSPPPFSSSPLPERSSTPDRFSFSKTEKDRLSPQLSRFSSLLAEGSPSSRRELFSK